MSKVGTHTYTLEVKLPIHALLLTSDELYIRDYLQELSTAVLKEMFESKSPKELFKV